MLLQPSARRRSTRVGELGRGRFSDLSDSLKKKEVENRYLADRNTTRSILSRRKEYRMPFRCDQTPVFLYNDSFNCEIP